MNLFSLLIPQRFLLPAIKKQGDIGSDILLQERPRGKHHFLANCLIFKLAGVSGSLCQDSSGPGQDEFQNQTRVRIKRSSPFESPWPKMLLAILKSSIFPCCPEGSTDHITVLAKLTRTASNRKPAWSKVLL